MAHEFKVGDPVVLLVSADSRAVVHLEQGVWETTKRVKLPTGETISGPSYLHPVTPELFAAMHADAPRTQITLKQYCEGSY